MFFFISFVLGWVCAQAAFAAVRLWDEHGEMILQYDNLAFQLDQQEVELAPHRTVKVHKRLGKGTNTYIYDIGNGKALRIPKSSSLAEGNVPYSAFIEFYFDGYKKLKNTELPIVKVYEEESDRGKFLIVDKIQERFTLAEFLKNNNDPQILKELDEFARKSWQIRQIGDMHTGQIAYTDHGWVLMDYADSVKRATSVGDATMFSDMKGLPILLKKHLDQVAAEERKAHSNVFTSSKIQCLFDGFRRNIKGVLSF